MSLYRTWSYMKITYLNCELKWIFIIWFLQLWPEWTQTLFSSYYIIIPNGITVFSGVLYKWMLYLAKGEQYADCADGKFMLPDSSTCWPGTNFKLFGFGVSCTWINIVLAFTKTEQGHQQIKHLVKTWLLSH